MGDLPRRGIRLYGREGQGTLPDQQDAGKATGAAYLWVERQWMEVVMGLAFLLV